MDHYAGEALRHERPATWQEREAFDLLRNEDDFLLVPLWINGQQRYGVGSACNNGAALGAQILALLPHPSDRLELTCGEAAPLVQESQEELERQTSKRLLN